MRRYFKQDLVQATVNSHLMALNVCIGRIYNQKHSLNKDTLLIKTNQTIIDKLLLDNPEYTLQQIMDLNFCTEMTKEEAIELVNSPEFIIINT